MTDVVAELPLVELIRTLPNYDPYDDCEGYYFDEKIALQSIRWIEHHCTLTKGKNFAGKPFILEPWQKADVANIFGWLSEDDGSRRYKEVFIYVPRKNGKTELVAAINLLILYCDQELGGEIYTAASNEDQAKIVWNVSKIMIEQNKKLKDNSQVFTKSIVHGITGSFYKFIPANPAGTHGANSHAITVDELHACNEDHIEVLETSQGARFQPIFIYTTTADFDRPSICNKTLDRAMRICSGDLKDPNFLPVVYQALKEDDWHSEETWKKANPNYGVSLNIKEFKRAYQKACDNPRSENTFKRLRLNMKTEQSERWIQLLLWDLCGKNKERTGDAVGFRGHPDDIEKMRGRPCYLGLDLSSTIDTSGLELVFPEDDYKVISLFWIPEDTAEMKEKSDKVPYRQWAKEGWLKMTPGNRIDYDFIEHKILEIAEIVNVKKLGFDPWSASDLSMRLDGQHGMPMTVVRQGFRSMSEPCKRLEADMAKGEMDHGGNPILRWMAANVMIKKDPAGNIKPDKEKSSTKIDGISALVTAYAVMIADLEEISPYEEHGILSLGGDDDDDDWGREDDDTEDDDDDDTDDTEDDSEDDDNYYFGD